MIGQLSCKRMRQEKGFIEDAIGIGRYWYWMLLGIWDSSTSENEATEWRMGIRSSCHGK